MTGVMRPNIGLTQVYLYQPSIDFRKSHLGLCALIECELGHNPFTGHLYAFTNKRRNKIKCLFWEDNGFVLYYKSLAEDKFKWPKRGEEVITLTGQQINWLLDGYDISAMQGYKKLQYESVF
ncbi:IS66 family insertion sequence element accessory protein TnpB [Algibacillus agarilyticus]|uniref:IS66 family insertion sequence element accessory protein TnpB n=1 Tax=Algibacillus agarilyticus TaxID=2234133 RepID=UPI000DCF6D38|nr:IS66 family insertion sequence element accessory protein TnpB [Algibacillus agarilyticus]